MSDAPDIDALLAAPKTLVGTPHWVRDTTSAVVKLVAPIAVDGVVGSLVLHAHANLYTTPQRGGCVLVYEGRPIQRLSVQPDHAHHNPFHSDVPKTHRGVTLPAGMSRFHPWHLNRVWPRPLSDNVAVAELVEMEFAAFENAVTIFLQACAIKGVLPSPPWEPRLI